MKKILIVEDEPSLRDNLRTLLELEGYEVVVTADGRQALLAVGQWQPDLVLTDVMMPLLDGYGLIQAMREDPRTAFVPVILLTARADRADVRKGMNLGADDFLVKPCPRDELLQAIQARLARSARHQRAPLSS